MLIEIALGLARVSTPAVIFVVYVVGLPIARWRLGYVDNRPVRRFMTAIWPVCLACWLIGTTIVKTIRRCRASANACAAV